MQVVQVKTVEQEFKDRVLELIAIYDTQHRSEMVKRAMKSRVLQGYLPTRPPLGYEPTIVKGLYRPTKLGNAMGNILRRLANGNVSVTEAICQLKLLIETKTDRKMTAYKLLRLLANPYYGGMLCCQGKQYLGKHTPLVSSEQHEAILELLRDLPEKSKGKE